MVHQDTIRLLRECDAGAAMGVRALSEVLPHAGDSLRALLNNHKAEHEQIVRDIRTALDRFGDDGKSPNPVAQKMAQIKIDATMTLRETDAAIASLMTDGANMGIKSLSKYLNQYAAADENAKSVCKHLIAAEENLERGMRAYL